MLRPRPCRWFELVATRDDLAPLLAALGQGGAVELQTHERRAAPLAIAGVERQLERYRELAHSDRMHWPPPAPAPASGPLADPAARLAACVAQLEAWHQQAEPLLAESEVQAAQARGLDDLLHLLEAGAAVLPPPELLATSPEAQVQAQGWVLPAQVPASELPAGLLQLPLASAAGTFLVLAGRSDDLARAGERLLAAQGRPMPWPAGLGGTVPEAQARVAALAAALAMRREALARRLQAMAEQHELPQALADIALVAWLVQHGRELSASARLVWVTGWTTATDAAALCAPLHLRGLRCLVQFPQPPAGSEPPSLLVNPPWARAFETFARLLGQPGSDEADPSRLLALIAPVLFGFMFGDVGQGAVLCAAGLLLRQRMPTLALLVPGGVMAMFFGLLFGSVFAREDLIPALWLHPLAEPITLLGAALALGAAILLCGLALNVLQAAWRHGLRHWWMHDAALLVAYAGALAAPWHPQVLWLVALGAAWAALGACIGAPTGRIAALAAGLAHFVEQALQLAVNTVSFARVGAFALAHAGLSVAVVGVAEALGGLGYAIALVLGNLLILLLEGLVVGIQTTRLLLFEFFVRFLEGRGRAFKPLLPPAAPSLP